MSEQELRDIWSNSSRTAHISIETSQLVGELNGKMSRIQKVIRRRDLREISASVIGIVIFAYFLIEIPFPITRIACGLSIVWFAYVIYRFQQSKAQNKETNLALPIAEQLSVQNSMMVQQAKLLETAAYWYALPSLVTNIIFILGLGNPSDYDWVNSIAEQFLPLSPTMKITTLLGLSVFYAFVVWINRRAAKKGIQPILKGIHLVQAELDDKH